MKLKKPIQQHYPIILALLLYLIFSAFYLQESLKRTNNQLVYPLDDTYIHMAMAKNFSTYGVWGITKHEFTSTSSSPFWTLILSIAYKILGVKDYFPLIINFLISILILIIAYKYSLDFKLKALEIFILLLMIIFLVPLIALSFTGLEHTLHSLLSLMFINYFIRSELLQKETEPKFFNRVLLIIPFFIMTRYESLFIIFSALLILMIKRRYSKVLKIAVISSITISFYGIISIANGWSFFPNSLLMKSQVSFPPNPMIYFYELKRIFDYLTTSTNIISFTIPLIALIILIHLNYKLNQNVYYPLLILLVTLLSQIFFAQFGLFFRYEGYIFSSGIFIIFLSSKYIEFKNEISSNNSFRNLNNLYLSILIIVLLIPFFKRESLILSQISIANKNIYQQQIQTANFVKTYFNNETILLNDIGAVNYYADINCIDSWGLGSIEVKNAKVENKFSPEFINKLASEKNVNLVIIYESWFLDKLEPLKNWIKIGSWQIFDNVICGGDVVSFFVTDSTKLEKAVSNFNEFSKTIVKGVLVNTHYH